MSTSETESEPELATGTVSSLTAFVHLSTTRLSQGTVGGAVDTLATLDFRLVRKDTALHGVIQDCASTILAFFNNVLEQDSESATSIGTGASCDFIPDLASIFRPSFLHLLFQYRRLFRVIAARDFNLGSAPLATICWVDLVLARLGDVTAFVAAGLDGGHPDRSLPVSLKAQREEDNLRAAMQLPDNWDMLPSMVLSERTSMAAKRLSTRLMLGGYILCPALSGTVGVDHTIHRLLSTFAEFIRRCAARLGELRSLGLHHLLQQEILTGAMAISLYAAADMAQDPAVKSERTAVFRPQTIGAAMQLLQFALNGGGHPTQTNILCPLDHLNIPTSVILRWGIVPQWTWSIWLEYHDLHGDTIMCLTTSYIQHRRASSAALLEVSDMISADSRLSNRGAMISVMIELVFRFISVLSADGYSKQLSTSMIGVLEGSCRLMSQWMNQNSCGIQNSMECCKAMVLLFGYLPLNERHLVRVNDLVIECLVSMTRQCVRDAWKAAVEDDKFCFLEALGQTLIQTNAALSSFKDGVLKLSEIYAAQLMQFFVVMMSKGVEPFKLDTFTNFVEAVEEHVVEMPWDDQGILCETLFICLASANLSRVDLPFGKFIISGDEEAVWHLWACSEMNLFLASAFSLYITSGLVSVEPLTYLEGIEHLLDVALLICSRHCPHEVEPLALAVLPAICDALAHLVEHCDTTVVNMRISALGGVLRSLDGGEDSSFGAWVMRGLSSTARRVLLGDEKTRDEETRREYELVLCRLDGLSHLVYV